MGSNLTFELPRAFCEDGEADVAKSVSMLAKAEAHILGLRRQEAFFSLRRELLDYPSVKVFSFQIGQHYNDEGYSDHINMRVEFVDEEGALQVSESDEEYGSLPEEAEHLDELRYFIGELPQEVISKLSGERINCDDERALAVCIMGASGFAHFEAEALERAAKLGVDGVQAPRL